MDLYAQWECGCHGHASRMGMNLGRSRTTSGALTAPLKLIRVSYTGTRAWASGMVRHEKSRRDTSLGRLKVPPEAHPHVKTQCWMALKFLTDKETALHKLLVCLRGTSSTLRVKALGVVPGPWQRPDGGVASEEAWAWASFSDMSTTCEGGYQTPAAIAVAGLSKL